MAGKQCEGGTNYSGLVRNSKAFCEGMAYRASGTETTKAVTDNPHASGTDAYTAWDAGWDIAEAAKESTISAANAGCCAMIGAAPGWDVTVPDLSGLTEAAAEAALIAADLILGDVTGTGTVSAQDPAAAATVANGTAVDITLA